MITSTLLVIGMMSITTPCSSQDVRHPIRDLVAVNGDTLIAADWEKGCIVTYDAGKHWTPTAPNTHFKKMTVDNKGVVWAIDSWIGIHEEDHSRIYRSADGGK